MSLWQWLTTPSSGNGTADPTVSWPEGMSPSAVNDSARNEMSRIAEYRDLIAAKILTTGTGAALVLASGQTPAFDTLAHMDGQQIGFTAHVTNTGAVTLAVDGLTACPVRSQTGAAGNLSAGVLVLGTPYLATFYNATSEFILHNFVGNPNAVPLGSFLFHSVNTAPNSNFVLPIGQAISRTTYAAYFAMVGTTFGVGDGVTTFNVPDLRSYLLATSILGGGDPGRITTAGSGIDGATVGAHGGAQTVTVAQANLPVATLTTTITDPGHIHGLTAPVTFAGPGTSGGSPNNIVQAGTATTQSATTGITASTALGGSGTALNKMPPTFVLPIILRVL